MKRRILFGGVAAVVVGLLLAGGALVLLRRSGAVSACDPTAVRAWAAEGFDARVSSKPPVRWPTTLSGVRPVQTVTRSSTPDGERLTIEYDPMPRRLDPSWAMFERVAVGPTMAATLPGGVDVELVYWKAGSGPWLSPIDGSPLAVQPEPRITQDRGAGFTFAVQIKGGNVRAHGSSLFDRSTKVSLANGSGWRGPTAATEDILEINFSTQVHHRSSLMLEVPLVYGPEVVKVLDLEDDAKVQFGTDLEVEFLARGPGGVRTTFSSNDHVGFGWDPSYGSDGRGWATFTCFPFEAVQKIKVRAVGSKSWESVYGRTQVPLARAVPVAAQELEISYQPHAVRLQFELPPPATLPEVDDLFDVELGTLGFGGTWALISALEQCLQVEIDGGSGLNLEGLSYPMTIPDATPKRLVEIAMMHAAPDARLDLETFRFDGRRASMAARLGGWLEAQARKLGF